MVHVAARCKDAVFLHVATLFSFVVTHSDSAKLWVLGTHDFAMPSLCVCTNLTRCQSHLALQIGERCRSIIRCSLACSLCQGVSLLACPAHTEL